MNKIYMSDESRISHIKRIEELIVELGKVPTNELDLLSNLQITSYLNEFKRLVRKELIDETLA